MKQQRGPEQLPGPSLSESCLRRPWFDEPVELRPSWLPAWPEPSSREPSWPEPSWPGPSSRGAFLAGAFLATTAFLAGAFFAPAPSWPEPSSREPSWPEPSWPGAFLAGAAFAAAFLAGAAAFGDRRRCLGGRSLGNLLGTGHVRLELCTGLEARGERLLHLHDRTGTRVARGTGGPLDLLEGAEAGDDDTFAGGHRASDGVDDGVNGLLCVPYAHRACRRDCRSDRSCSQLPLRGVRVVEPLARLGNGR